MDRVVSGGLNNSEELFTARAARADLLSKAGLAAQAAAARTTLALRAEPVLLELRGRAIIQGAVSATRVIEGFDIVEDHQFGDRFGWRNRVAEAFGFQRGDEALSQGIVIGIAFAAHACATPGTLVLAEKLRDQLQTEFCEVALWSDDPRSQSSAALFELLDGAAERFDFAAIILVKDDVTLTETDDTLRARDTSGFQAGLFMAKIGGIDVSSSTASGTVSCRRISGGSSR